MRKKKNYNLGKIAVRCECGAIVRGNSQKNAEANLKNHKKSKQHKKFISLNKDISLGLIDDASGALTPKLNKKKEGVN